MNTTRTSVLTGLAGLTTAGLLLSMQTAATADTSVIGDAKGDAVPAIDITSLRVVNGARNLKVRFNVPGWNGGQKFRSADLILDTKNANGTGFLIEARQRPDHKWRYTMSRIWIGTDAPPQQRKCNLVFSTLDGGIRFDIPQRCFGKQAGRVRVSAVTWHKNPDQRRDSAPKAPYQFSRWVERG